MSFGGRVCFNCESKEISDRRSAIGTWSVPVAFFFLPTLDVQIQAFKKTEESFLFFFHHLDFNLPQLLRL